MNIDILSLPFNPELDEYVIDSPIEKILPITLAVALQLRIAGEPYPFEDIIQMANWLREEINAQGAP